MKQPLNLRQQFSINLRYFYSSRRATQNMSATRNSPIIGLNLRAMPVAVAIVSLHYLPRRQHSIVACGKTPTTVTWSPFSKIVAMLLLRNKGHGRTIRSRVSQPASAGKERIWVNCKLIIVCYRNKWTRLLRSVPYRQTNRHCKYSPK